MAALLLFISLLLVPQLHVLSQSDPVQANRQQGRPYQALYHLEAAADREGWSAQRLRTAGDLWLEMGDVTRAVPYWEAASISLTDDMMLIQQLAEAYVLLQRWPEAANQLERLVAADSGDSWAQFHLGIMKAAFDPVAAQGHLRAAQATYGTAVADLLAVIRADDPLLPMRVGLALAEAEMWPYAELAFRHAVDVLPDVPEAMAYVGLARDQQGKDGGEWVERAIALGPDSHVVRYLRGLHLRGEGDYSASLDAFIQAVALDPQSPAYYAELGTAYHLLGDLENAERWLQVAVDISNRDPRFQHLLALFYVEEGLEAGSGELSLLQTLAETMPDDLDVQAGYAMALYREGSVESALEQIDSVLEQAPDQPRALYYKAQILLETDRLDEARPLYEQVAALESPFQEEAQRILQGMGGS